MRSPRVAAVGAVGAVAVVAVLGATVNLHLLAPRPSRYASLVSELVPDTTPTRPGGPTSTSEREPGASTTTLSTATTAPPSDASTTTRPPDGSPPGSSPPPTSSTTPPSTTPPSTPARSYSVGQAGTVVLSVRAGTLVVELVQPSTGWSSTTLRPSPQEAEIDFHRAEPSQDAELHARLEDGQIVVEIQAPTPGPDD